MRMKVCFVFSNRAEYSELEPFVKYFKMKISTREIDLSKKIKNIHYDENLFKIYQICYKIFSSDKFDYVLILGDRRELPFIALAAFFTKTKLIHLAAGEYVESTTTLDQFLRPNVTLLSNFQICFSNEAKKNVRRLFSSVPYLKPNVIFCGNPVFRGINTKSLPRIIKESYDIVLLHPQSLSRKNTERDIHQLRKCLKNKKTVFIFGNKDTNYDLIEDLYNELKKSNKNYDFFETLTKKKYFSLVKHCDNFFTNSSSIYEIMYLNKKCLKIIGDRNKNRTPETYNNKAPEIILKLIKNSISKK